MRSALSIRRSFLELPLRGRQTDDGLGVGEFAFAGHLSGFREQDAFDLDQLVGLQLLADFGEAGGET